MQRRTQDSFEQALGDAVQNEDAPCRISFEPTDQFPQVSTLPAIDLLRAIAQYELTSIWAAIRVIEFAEHGRAKQSIVLSDEIEIQIPLWNETETDVAPT